jgi:hypothetical protein
MGWSMASVAIVDPEFAIDCIELSVGGVREGTEGRTVPRRSRKEREDSAFALPVYIPPSTSS